MSSLHNCVSFPEKITIHINKNAQRVTKQAKPSLSITENSENEPSIPQHQIEGLKTQCHEELLEVCRNFAVERQSTLSSIMNLAAISTMAKLLPDTQEKFMRIQYVTKANYEKYGAAFLAVTQKYKLLLDRLAAMPEARSVNEANSDDEWKSKSPQKYKPRQKRKTFRSYRRYKKMKRNS